jgi:GAF domain-containing protein
MVALDATHVTTIGTIAVAPFLTALLGGPLETAVVALAAAVSSVASGSWEHSFSSSGFYVRDAIVAVSGVIAVLAALDRRRRELARRRFELLTSLSNVGNTPSTLEDTAQRLVTLMVPAVADICAIDAHRGEEMRRLAVRASGPDAESIEAFLQARAPQGLATTTGSTRLSSARANLLREITPETLARWASDEEDRRGLEALEIGSIIVAELHARGEHIGTLTLVARKRSRRRYDEDDVEFATVIGGRAALALDNALLSRRLAQREQHLVGALGSFAAAMVLQDATGALIYASDAALQLLGAESAGELHGLRGGVVGLGFEVFDERGNPASPSQLPGRRLLAGEPAPPSMLIARPSPLSGEERWLLLRSRGTRTEEGALLSVVTELEDVTPRKRVELANALLTEASDLLSASHDYEAMSRSIVELAVGRLADWCAVSVPDGRGGLRRLAVAGAANERGALLLDVLEGNALGGESGLAVLEDGRARVLNDIYQDDLHARQQTDAPTAAMVVPLSASGRVVGVMSVAIARPGRRFGDSDLALAEELGRRAGWAIENARSYTQRSNIAETLQRALRPAELEAPPGWSLATWYQPAGEDSMVGGDFYDLFPVSDGHVLVIGDVTGHGALAARLTGLARFTLRTAAELTHDPRMAVHRLDAALLAQQDVTPVSAICAHLRDGGSDAVRATIAVAGHPLPLLLRSGRLREIGRGGTLAGAASGADWPESDVDLRPGDTLIFYTDGIPEARNDVEMFGYERLTACVQSGSGEPREIVARVQSALASFWGAGAARDDVTLLALQLVSIERGTSGAQPTPERRRRPLARLRGGARHR